MPRTNDKPSNKVARLIEEYELHGLGDELEEKWTADGSRRMSLRSLADYFNRRLLERTMSESQTRALENDVKQTYEHLVSDEVSAGVKTDTRNKLKQAGIDVDTLEQNFVTYQAIRSYLTEFRGVDYRGLSDEEKVQKDLKSIRRLVTRTQTVTEDRIEKLQDTDRVMVDDFVVLLNLQVLCKSCGKQYPVTEFLERRGCDCQAE